MNATPGRRCNAAPRRARIDDSRKVMTYNVMATFGVVIDAKVVHAKDVAAWPTVEDLVPAIIA